MSLRRLNVEKKYRLFIFPNSPLPRISTFSLGQKGCAYNEENAYLGCAYYESAQYISNPVYLSSFMLLLGSKAFVSENGNL